MCNWHFQFDIHSLLEPVQLEWSRECSRDASFWNYHPGLSLASTHTEAALFPLKVSAYGSESLSVQTLGLPYISVQSHQHHVAFSVSAL